MLGHYATHCASIARVARKNRPKYLPRICQRHLFRLNSLTLILSCSLF
jgi:hypothetical protein